MNMHKEIYRVDPFISIDPLGVGTLVEMGVLRGRMTRPMFLVDLW